MKWLIWTLKIGNIWSFLFYIMYVYLFHFDFSPQHGFTGGDHRIDGPPPLSEAEFEDIMNRNRTVSSSAIARAVADASSGILFASVFWNSYFSVTFCKGNLVVFWISLGNTIIVTVSSEITRWIVSAFFAFQVNMPVQLKLLWLPYLWSNSRKSHTTTAVKSWQVLYRYVFTFKA